MTTAISEQKKPSAAPPPIPADAGSPSVNIAVSRIVPSPWNRKAEVTDDLVESVRQDGVLQNVILRPHKATEEDVALYSMQADPFGVGDSILQLVAGERRWGAAKKAGRSHVPAAVRHLSDIDAMRLQIKENEDRENLRPMERAEAYDRLRMLYMAAHAKDPGYTDKKCMEHVAATVNKEPRTVYQIIQLKKLIRDAQTCLRNGVIEASHGYELCRRSEEEQAQLLTWLKVQTTHSQGDVPSIRRLQMEIRRLDIAAEEKKRQEKLFKEPQPGTATTRVPTVAEAAEKKEPGWIDRKAPVQQSAPDAAVNKAIAKYKPPTEAQLKAAEQQREKEAKAAEKRRQQEAKAQRDAERNVRINKTYDAAFFTALATKAHVCSRMLTHIVPDLIYEVWDNRLPIEAFAQTVLGWPAPKDGNAYSYNEVRSHCVKHTRKFGAKGVLPALLITLYQNPPDAERLSKYFGVDPKKLRKQAAAQIAEEDRKARLPKVPTTQKEKWLHAALHHVVDADKRWAKLRRTGASDAEIRATLKSELGMGGSSSGGDLANGVAFIGGQNPVVFFNSSTWSRSKKPSLQGAALIAAVRDLLKIPEKGDVDA